MASIDQLKALMALEKHRNFAKAASSCHVSQPSFTIQLQKLEDELGVVLFDRSKRPLLTTDIGLKIINQARIVVSEFNKIYTIAQFKNNELSGVFRLGIIPTLSPYLIPLFLQDFLTHYPFVHLELHEIPTELIMQKLLMDELDGGILAIPLKNNLFIERHLFYEPLYVYLNSKHDFLKCKKIDLNELSDQKMWILEKSHCLREQIIEICNLNPKNKCYENLHFEVGSLETIKNLVKKNDGLAILPFLATLNMTKEEKSFIRPIIPPIPKREIGLVHARSFHKEKILDVLQSKIIDVVKNE